MEQGKPSAATDRPLVDFDTVCQRVRSALEAARVHAVSLHDDKGDVLWLTESSMGPDEHNAVREGFDAFAAADARPIFAYDLGDSRSAVLFRAVTSRRMAGAIMVVVDTRGIPRDDAGLARLMTPKLQRVITDFAALRSAHFPTPAAAVSVPANPPAFELTLADSMRMPAPAMPPPGETAPARPQPPRATPPAQNASPRTLTGPALTPPAQQPARGIPAPGTAAPGAPPRGATPRVSPPVPTPASPPTLRPVPDIGRLQAAMRRSPIALHVQRLVPLAKGSQLRRYEVLLRSAADIAPNAAPQAMLQAAVDNGLGSLIDRRVLTQLIGWLVQHPGVWRDQAVQFSVNLTRTALEDEHFFRFVALCLEKSSLPKSMIAFEINVPTAMQLGGRILGVATALERLGCPLVLDDFGLRTECFELLRLPAVRYVKLEAGITARMRSDKLSQAAITAVVQMARVLGMHTVAKRTETAAEHEWLTALGVDFVQSNAASPPVAIDSLAKSATPNP